MIIDLKRAAAYICPFCSQIYVHPVSLFQLNSSAPAILHCGSRECGEECVSISRGKRGFQLEIECPVCGDIHHFSTPAASFISKPLLIYTCPNSGVNIFFLGLQQKVEAALKSSSEALKNIKSEETDDDSLTELKLLYTLVAVVHELICAGRVSCSCKSHDIVCTIDNAQLLLTCSNCGASMRIPPNREALERLSTTRSIVIKGN